MPIVGRPVFYPELGEFFQQLRDGKNLGLRQAAQRAGKRGLTALTKSTIYSLEHGLTKDIDADLLRAMATLYDFPYEMLVLRVVAVRYHVALATNPKGKASDVEPYTPPPPALKGEFGEDFQLLWNDPKLDYWAHLDMVNVARRFLGLPRVAAPVSKRKGRPTARPRREG